MQFFRTPQFPGAASASTLSYERVEAAPYFPAAISRGVVSFAHFIASPEAAGVALCPVPVLFRVRATDGNALRDLRCRARFG